MSCIGHVINNIGQRLIEINITPPASESGNKVDDLPLNEEDIIDDSEILESDKSTQQTMLRDLLTKVKEMVTFFRHSERATTELLSLQNNLPEAKRLKLIQEVKTRWNCCFEMINHFIVLADHVGKVLLQKTENFKPDTLIGRQLQKKLTQEIETKYGNIESVKLYACATLDPRIERNLALQATGSSAILDDDDVTTMIEAQVSSNDGNDDDIWSYLDEAVNYSHSQADTDEAGKLPIQLRQYFSRPALQRRQNPNPLVVWESIKYEYPHLWSVARKFLLIVATSVPCERLFSHAGLISNQLRSRLSPQHLNQLVFLRSVGEDMWDS
ncbi:Similar to Putative AC9 transposase (Zea mays) [Cotesia congregata]|uniref:Similar to Putative AC9 transposase (Zea mays) n=1 Tax=Cotesia congregata TaxID=51543 RepID=A0A8J2HJA4_COTCN|nr:Similar to Putative AC9 transposase (Zea mays) [Cotesia congregata]